MAPIQRTLRRAFGSFKDQTRISLARVAGSTAPDLEIALVKATSHDELPPSEKHIHDILQFCNSRFFVKHCVAGLARRLSKTRNWIVALKVIVLAHRLLRDGNPAFEQELKVSGRRLLDVSDFKDESHGNAWDYSAFVRIYGLYLKGCLDCPIGSLGARAISERVTTYRQSSFDYGGGAYNQNVPEDRSRREEDFEYTTKKNKPVREMQADELLETFSVLQRMLERVFACRPTGEGRSNRLIQFALLHIVKDSFQIYSDMRDGLAILLDAFFDMEQRYCVTVFDIYIRAGQQVDELISFYSVCKTMALCKATEYPAVEKITEDLLETLEEFLKHQFESARDTMPRSPERHRPPRIPAEGGCYEINGVKTLPSPVTPLSEESPNPSAKPTDFPKHDRNAKPEVNAVHFPNADANVKGMNFSAYDINTDLLDFSEQSMSLKGHGEKLGLALVPVKDTTANTKWETFSSAGGEGMAKKPGAEVVKNSSTGPAVGWELALVDSKSDVSKPNGKASMAGGFDRFILDNLYDQAALQDRHKFFVTGAIASSGSASSVASMKPPIVGPKSSLLALPAPPGTDQQSAIVQVQDPFAASVNVPPPTYVDMADFKRKQQLLVQEQQLWLQYQHNGIHAYNAFFKFANSNAYGTSFQPAPYSVPYHSVNSFHR